jgi:hypothetical protein
MRVSTSAVFAVGLLAALVASLAGAIPPLPPTSMAGLWPRDGGTWPLNGALGLTQTRGSAFRKDDKGAVVEVVVGDIEASIDGVAARVVQVPERAPGASPSEWEVLLDPLPQPGQQVVLRFTAIFDPKSHTYGPQTVGWTATAPDTTAPPAPTGLTLDLVHQEKSGCGGDLLVWHASLLPAQGDARVRVEFRLRGEAHSSQVLRAGDGHAMAASSAMVGWWRNETEAMCVRARTLDAAGQASEPIEVCRAEHVKVVDAGDAATLADPPVFTEAERVPR